MAKKTEKERQAAPAYLRSRGAHWRSLSLLLVLQAVCWAGAAVLAYAILSPQLAKDFFSAHSTVKATSRLVVPALAVAATAGFFVTAVVSALSLRAHARSLLAPLRPLDDLIRAAGAGRIPRLADGGGRPATLEEVAAAFVPLRERIEEVQRLARDVRKVSLELNYRAAGTADVTLKDLRELAARLDKVAGDLAHTTDWFEL